MEWLTTIMISIITKPDILSEIFRDVGQVFFASMALGPLLNSIGVNWLLVLIGLVLAVSSWSTSVFLSRS